MAMQNIGLMMTYNEVDIIHEVMDNNLKTGTCLNVNIPYVKEENIKGIKVCKQGRAFWDDTFDHRSDPFGKDYFWLTGSFGSKDNDKEADIHYLENNYVTVVPTQFDMTCYQSLNELTKWNFNEI